MFFMDSILVPVARLSGPLGCGALASQLFGLKTIVTELIISVCNLAVAVHQFIFPTVGVISLICLLSQVIHIVRIEKPQPLVVRKKTEHRIDCEANALEPTTFLGPPAFKNNTWPGLALTISSYRKTKLQKSFPPDRVLDWTLLENVLHAFCLLLAASLSVCAVENGDRDSMRHWLIFWMLYLTLGVIENVLEPTGWTAQPLYLLVRLVLVTWLSCCGSDAVYCLLKKLMTG